MTASTSGSPNESSDPPKRTSRLAIALAWAVVVIPAAWGISQTLRTSMRLFAPAAKANQPAAQPASMPAETQPANAAR